MKSTVYLAFPIMLFSLILQVSVLSRFPLLGMVPQISLLAATSWGLLRGPEEGVLWAFVGGLLLDLFTSGPIGGMTLSMMLAVFVVALLRRNFPSSSFFLPILYAGLATLIYLAAYLALARIHGAGASARSISALMPLIVLNSLVMLPVHWLLAQLERLVNPRRVEF